MNKYLSTLNSPLIEGKNKNFPTISIGIVTLNCVEHIKIALDSVVHQSYQNLELIVVDGGSNDGTLAVLAAYSKYISFIISEEDRGIYDAMNKVCTHATGDWLIFLGGDDKLLDVVGDIIHGFDQPEAVYHGDAILKSSAFIHGGVFSKFKLIQKNICHQSIFYPKKAYKKYSYSLEYRWLADYYYNICLVRDRVPLIYIGVPVVVFNDLGASSLGDADFERDKFKIIRSSFGLTYAIAYALMKLLRMLIPAIVLNILRGWRLSKFNGT